MGCLCPIARMPANGSERSSSDAALTGLTQGKVNAANQPEPLSINTYLLLK